MRTTTLRRNFAAVLVLAACGSRAAEGAAPPDGRWVLNIGPRTLLILSITAPPAAGGSFSGALSRPSFQSDGWSFSHVGREIKTAPIVASSWDGTALSITVQNPSNPSDKDTFVLTLKDDTHAQLRLQGVPLPPFNLTRAQGTPVISTDWDETKIYAPDDGAVSNPEMKRIYDEDQRVRQDMFKVDWSVVNKSDAERREATRKLLNDDALHTAEDFNWAAFVFQHGSTPADFLLAHTLAMVAVKKGYGSAIWIASATLDRYLHTMNQPQIYGTQFRSTDGHPMTQDPYDRSLVSDALRHQLGVPVQSEQEEQLKQFENQRAPGK